jgi:hypothetical protein
MVRVLLDDVIETDYGLFELLWNDGRGFDGRFELHFAGQVNGLVGAASGQNLYVNLARRSGGSSVRIVLLEDAPSPDPEAWEDIVEVSVVVPPNAEPVWNTRGGEHCGPLDLPAGSYRVRTSARGRDAGQQGDFADGVVDRYLLEFWPAPEQPDAIVQSTSDDAAYWHGEVGSRR